MALYDIAGLKVEMKCRGIMSIERSKAYLAKEDGVPDFSVEVDDELLAKGMAKYPNSSMDSVEYMYLGALFYRKLAYFNGVMLHSSCVVVDGKAYCFSAPCGTGKSTHTGLYLKYFGDRAYILNDDKPAIRLCEDGKVYAFGTPFSGKHDISRNVGVPLAGICFIQRAEENSISPSKKMEALVKLLSQTIHPKKADDAAQMYDVLDKIFDKLKIWDLYCNMDLSAVETSYSAMSGAVNE